MRGEKKEHLKMILRLREEDAMLEIDFSWKSERSENSHRL